MHAPLFIYTHENGRIFHFFSKNPTRRPALHLFNGLRSVFMASPPLHPHGIPPLILGASISALSGSNEASGKHREWNGWSSLKFYEQTAFAKNAASLFSVPPEEGDPTNFLSRSAPISTAGRHCQRAARLPLKWSGPQATGGGACNWTHGCGRSDTASYPNHLSASTCRVTRQEPGTCLAAHPRHPSRNPSPSLKPVSSSRHSGTKLRRFPGGQMNRQMLGPGSGPLAAALALHSLSPSSQIFHPLCSRAR